MTERKSFKRLVRARMEKTGESYTAARASLLAGKEKGRASAAAVMPISDEAIRNRTARGWEQWFDLLDESGAGERTHREIAASLADEHGVDGWSAQSITVAYERARKGRADMPYPPDYPKMPGEPKRVQPSRDRDRPS